VFRAHEQDFIRETLWLFRARIVDERILPGHVLGHNCQCASVRGVYGQLVRRREGVAVAHRRHVHFGDQIASVAILHAGIIIQSITAILASNLGTVDLSV
jgi:hypothetical protein